MYSFVQLNKAGHSSNTQPPLTPTPDERATASDIQNMQVIICEDHDVTRVGLREICRRIGCRVIGETADGAEAIELVEELKPDMLILDMHLRDAIHGQTVHEEIRRRGLTTKVFVVSSHCDSARFFSWISQPDGPDGVLEKDASTYELRQALVQVLTTSTKYIPERIKRREHGDGSNPLRKLAPHQLEVLRDVAQGLRLVDIARQRSLSPQTVRSYMNDIYSKLELRHHTLQAATAEYNKWASTDGSASLPNNDL